MPFNRPNLKELIDRIAADLESRLPGSDARLRRSLLNVLGRSLAGAAHGLHGHLDWLAKQVLPDSADTIYLERWASIWGLTRKAAAKAAGTVGFTGTDGSLIPAGTLLQRSDGAEFTTTADAAIAAGVATAQVTAGAGGSTGNTAAGSPLSLVTPIAGIDSAASVAAAGLAGGADLEGDAELRARLLVRIQQPPHGGADFDYINWALEVAGVTRAWVYPAELGLGAVSVRFVVDAHPTSIIPDAAVVQAVQDHIDSLRPVTAAVTVVAPVSVPLDFTITLTPNTATVQAAVQAELEDLLRREAQPEDGAGSGKILLSHIREAISIAAGETDHALVAPVVDVTHTTGQIATMGNITWQ